MNHCEDESNFSHHLHQSKECQKSNLRVQSIDEHLNFQPFKFRLARRYRLIRRFLSPQ